LLIVTKGLTKCYGSLLAVDHIDLIIDRGEIVGLLGPNGAGKTTTMQMLACFLSATEGTALIAGYDIHKHPREARRHIGYMPENNPLYSEMRVNEYLKFRAFLKGVPRKRRNIRIAECEQLCGVRHVERQVIRTLSKGLRQRVGLADALLGDPDVLLLDEPTIGLDPNQIHQMRNVIRQLGERHTVLLSTHILQEAEAICERVLIIDRGKIVADDTPRALSAGALRGATIVELQGDASEQREGLMRIPQVKSVEVEHENGWNRFSIRVAGGADVREQVFSLAVGRGWPLRELTVSPLSLEDVFRRITMRDEDVEQGQP